MTDYQELLTATQMIDFTTTSEARVVVGEIQLGFGSYLVGGAIEVERVRGVGSVRFEVPDLVLGEVVIAHDTDCMSFTMTMKLPQNVDRVVVTAMRYDDNPFGLRAACGLTFMPADRSAVDQLADVVRNG